jgi:hypothetical protein
VLGVVEREFHESREWDRPAGAVDFGADQRRERRVGGLVAQSDGSHRLD